MMRRSDAVEERLKADGWTYDRPAMMSGYRPAGTVDNMQTRGGFKYCRVYTSTCKGKRKYQLTYVYRKEA